MRRHFSPAVSSHRQDREPFSTATIGHRVDVLGYVIVHHAHDLIDQERLRAGAFVPGGWSFLKTTGYLGATCVERVAQQLDDLRARLFTLVGGERVDRFGKRTAIDNRPLVCDLGGTQAGSLPRC